MSKSEQVREEHGLFLNVPRFLRRAIQHRLTRLESELDQFDRETLLHHAQLKRLYALLHIKPQDPARALLFGKPPAKSGRAALRHLVAAREDPQAAAEIVRSHRIPYLLVEAALGAVSPSVAVALIETLEPDEIIGRLALMSRRGLLEGEVHDALMRRLTGLNRNPAVRFSYAKIESVVRYAKLDRQLAAALFGLVQVGAGQDSLQGDTALIADVSSSMPREGGVLELAAGVAWRIDRALEPKAALHTCLAGLEATLILPLRRTSGVDQWRRTLTVATPETPGTSLGAALERLAQHRVGAARLILITDGYENRPPRLVTAYERYRTLTGQRPSIHLVQPAGAGLQLSVDLKNAQIPFGVFTVDHHRLGLDALIPALQTQSGETRLAQILAFE
jgi:hypothetical protein